MDNNNIKIVKIGKTTRICLYCEKVIPKGEECFSVDSGKHSHYWAHKDCYTQKKDRAYYTI